MDSSHAPDYPDMPASDAHPIELIPIDPHGPYADVLQIAATAVGLWAVRGGTLQQTRLSPSRALLNEGMLHLLELGILSINRERLDELKARTVPPARRQQ